MASYAQGLFTPINKQKYIGKNIPKYRSGWELTFMTFCDSNKNVLYWASESISIPYRHPFKGRVVNYIPDFFVVYQNKYGKQIAEMVEIKPKKQSIIESKVASARDKIIVAINHAKWASAVAYCKQHGYTFRVITENELFHNGRNK